MYVCVCVCVCVVCVCVVCCMCQPIRTNRTQHIYYLPHRRLSELFNINHHIVSQINPWVAPFLNSSGKSPSEYGLGTFMRWLFECLKYIIYAVVSFYIYIHIYILVLCKIDRYTCMYVLYLTLYSYWINLIHVLLLKFNIFYAANFPTHTHMQVRSLVLLVDDLGFVPRRFHWVVNFFFQVRRRKYHYYLLFIVYPIWLLTYSPIRSEIRFPV